MDFADQIQALVGRISKQLGHIQTEEATKTALVLPFINALGYNVFDPTEVCPEFICDVGIKKGEKIDYAIMKDGQVAMLIECKAISCDLCFEHASQLYRYFGVTSARIGVLTNGVHYQFFTDLDEPNKMDQKPFLEFNIMSGIPEGLVPEVKKLTKGVFDVAAITATAGELKYTKEMEKVLVRQLTAPDEEMVRLLASNVYPGRFTKAVLDQFTGITRRAFRNFVNDQISERLKSALEPREAAPLAAETPVPTTETSAGSGVETTADELEAFHIVRAILGDMVEPERVVPRDVKTYFGILLDDNNRKPIARLHFEAAQKYVGLFDNAAKEEVRVPIGKLTDIYKLAARIRATPAFYEKKPNAGGE